MKPPFKEKIAILFDIVRKGMSNKLYVFEWLKDGRQHK